MMLSLLLVRPILIMFSLFGTEIIMFILCFKVEPGTKLFPAVICEPTIKEMLQFELGATRVSVTV